MEYTEEDVDRLASEYLSGLKIAKTTTLDRAAEQPALYQDDLTQKILIMLESMTMEQKRQALRFIEGQKLLAEREKKLKEG
jgi:hypothetical protein